MFVKRPIVRWENGGGSEVVESRVWISQLLKHCLVSVGNCLGRKKASISLKRFLLPAPWARWDGSWTAEGFRLWWEPSAFRYYLCWPSFTVRTVLHGDRLAPSWGDAPPTSSRRIIKAPNSRLFSDLPRVPFIVILVRAFVRRVGGQCSILCSFCDVLRAMSYVRLLLCIWTRQGSFQEVSYGLHGSHLGEILTAVCLFVQGLSSLGWEEHEEEKRKVKGNKRPKKFRGFFGV